MAPTIRDYRPGDKAGAYHVCLKTGNHGDDGEPFFRDDPDALGRIFVGPYLEFQPDLSLILEDDEGICGYALGAFDSRQFYDRYEREWRPALCAQFPAPEGDSSAWTHVQWIHHLYHHPDLYCPEPYWAYPSHLHIDLMPRVHRQGFGQQMMDRLIGRIQASGSPGVHLGLAESNERAYRFYTKLAFVELSRRGEGEQASIYMGKRLNADPRDAGGS